MKHLKTFNSIFEEESMYAEETYTEKPDQRYQKNPPVAEAKSWVKSSLENADYDIVWDSPEGEEITASFSDSGYPVEDYTDETSFSTFESVPGTSSDGKDYTASVSYTKVNEGVLQITEILIFNK